MQRPQQETDLFRGDRLDALNDSKTTKDVGEARPPLHLSHAMPAPVPFAHRDGASPLTPANKASKACLVDQGVNDLRHGYTTGACAAAAAKAAAAALCADFGAGTDIDAGAGAGLNAGPCRMGKLPMDAVEIFFPDGSWETFPVSWIRRTETGMEAAVIKDAGDDPDITQGATIIAHVERAQGFTFLAGEGVGRVTRPGLQIPPGDAAINPGPRDMIRAAVLDAGLPGAKIRISIPGGEFLAEKTFNPRLGVVGGLSILGTLGRVKPFCRQSLQNTIELSLNVAKKADCCLVVLVPGNIGESAAVRLLEATGGSCSMPPPALTDSCSTLPTGSGRSAYEIISVSNEWGHALTLCGRIGFMRITLVGHPGKLSKLAQGHFDTHSARSPSPLPWILSLVRDLGGPSLDCLTVEGVFQALPDPLSKRLSRVLSTKIQESVRRHYHLDTEVFLSTMDGGLYSPLPSNGGHSQASDSATKESSAFCSPEIQATPEKQFPGQTQAVTVAGCGPGDLDLVTPLVRKMAMESDVLAGAQRLLDLFPESPARRIPYDRTLEAFLADLSPHLQGEKVLVLVSGDPGIASLAGTLQRRFPDIPIKRLPGISSIQLAFAETCMDWTHALIIRAHGRLPRWERTWDYHRGPFAILAGHPGALGLARTLAIKRKQHEIWVCERLSLPGQQIKKLNLDQIESSDIDPLSVLILEGVAP